MNLCIYIYIYIISSLSGLVKLVNLSNLDGTHVHLNLDLINAAIRLFKRRAIFTQLMRMGWEILQTIKLSKKLNVM